MLQFKKNKTEFARAFFLRIRRENLIKLQILKSLQIPQTEMDLSVNKLPDETFFLCFSLPTCILIL